MRAPKNSTSSFSHLLLLLCPTARCEGTPERLKVGGVKEGGQQWEDRSKRVKVRGQRREVGGGVGGEGEVGANEPQVLQQA